MSLLPAKPIFIAKVHFDDETPPRTIAEYVENAREVLTTQLNDYHVLIIPLLKNEVTQNCDVIFECFYPHEFDLKLFEEFKEQVLEQTKHFLTLK